jgi:hypothetical protein
MPSDTADASALAQTIDEDIHEAQRGRLPFPCALRVENSNQRAQKVLRRDIRPNLACSNRAIEQQAESSIPAWCVASILAE